MAHPTTWLGCPALVLLLALPASAQQPTEEPHQDHRTGAPRFPAAVNPGPAAVDSSRIRVTDHPERSELTIALGPIHLPARTSHHALRQLPVQHATVPFDLTIHGFRVEVVDGDGQPVPQTVLHHMNLLDPTSRELFLPIMWRVLAASHETKPLHLPGWLLGIPLEGGKPILALAMLHNPTDRSYEAVTVRMVLEYKRDRTFPLYRFYAFHLDVMFPVGSKAFDLPPGRTVRSYEASPVIAGGIVGVGGHLHRYARELVLEDVTEGRVLYRVEPVTDASGEILEVPAYRYRGGGLGLPVYPHRRYRVTVTYFNPTGETIRDGGMGAVAGGFIPFQAWPKANPGDPLYAADYRAVLESLNHGGAAHDHSHSGAAPPPAPHRAGEAVGEAASARAEPLPLHVSAPLDRAP